MSSLASVECPTSSNASVANPPVNSQKCLSRSCTANWRLVSQTRQESFEHNAPQAQSPLQSDHQSLSVWSPDYHWVGRSGMTSTTSMSGAEILSLLVTASLLGWGWGGPGRDWCWAPLNILVVTTPSCGDQGWSMGLLSRSILLPLLCQSGFRNTYLPVQATLLLHLDAASSKSL